jgi:hypothetical protein
LRARSTRSPIPDALAFDGVSLFASYGEHFLGDPKFDPVLAMLDERGAVVFVHPGLHPRARDCPAVAAFMMEYLFDTTRAVVNLVVAGAIARFPRIRFILPHAGGLAPYFAWRLSVSPMIDPRLPQLSRDEVYAASSISGTTTRSRRARRSRHARPRRRAGARRSGPTFLRQSAGHRRDDRETAESGFSPTPARGDRPPTRSLCSRNMR